MLYAFPAQRGGETLYYSDAYYAELALCESVWGVSGAQLFCTKLLLWREFFHLLGGVIVALVVHWIRVHLGTRAAVYISASLFIYILIQEFYIHPATHNQIFTKGLLDVLVWSLPATLYWALVLLRVNAPQKK